MSLEVVILVVAVALGFDFMNGFHDAANSIATVVSTPESCGLLSLISWPLLGLELRSRRRLGRES